MKRWRTLAPCVALSRGALLAVASALSYGSLAVLVKLAYGEGWNVPSLLVARFGLAALVVLPFALRQRFSWRGLGGGFLIGALGYAGTTGLFFPSLLYLPAAVSSFLLYLAPALVVALSWLLLREPVGARGLTALGVALVGLAILSAGAWDGRLPLVGVGLAAGSAVMFAFTIVASRRLVRDVPWAQSTLGVCLGAGTSYVVAALALGMLDVPSSGAGRAYALGIGVLATGIALSLFFLALQHIGASRTAVICTLEPVSTLVFAWIFIDEIPGWTGILGGLLITGAAAMIAWTRAEDAIPPPLE